MAKYLLPNNRSRISAWQWILIVGFIVTSLIYFTVPLARDPLYRLWRLSALAALTEINTTASPMLMNECLVIATPPQRAYDTVLLECNPRSAGRADGFVWYNDRGERYMVGKVSAKTPGGVVATMFSTGANSQPLEIRFSIDGEKYNAFPLGGGSFRVEVTASVQAIEGERVYHAVSKQLLGIISGVRIEKGSYVKRIYVRLPFSFEKLTRLEVQ